MAARTGPLPPLRRIGRQLELAALLVAFISFVSALGCQSEQERFDGFVGRASAALTKPGGEEAAVIELLNARQLRPDDADVNFHLGQARQSQGRLRDSVFFFEEAHQLNPQSTRVAIALALLLRSSDARRAASLLASAREREPENAQIYSAEAELALDREDPSQAVRYARRSVDIDPNHAFGHFALGRAHMGQIRMAQILEQRPPNAAFEGAETAFKRYEELLNPRDRWSSLIERARVLAAWPGHSDEALSMVREAMAAAEQHAPRAGKIRVATYVLEYARARNEDELRADTLEQLLELEPDHLRYWDELAQVREISAGEGGETLARLIEEHPDNAEAHLRYAGYLQATEGAAAAVAHLEKFSENEQLRLTLLGALVELHGATGQTAERNEAMLALQEDYPFHPVTLLVRANLAFQRGEIEDAVLDLRDLVQREDGAKAEGLLAYSEFALGRYGAALEASSRAIELNPRFESELLELRANAAYALGDCATAGRAMLRLLWQDQLDAKQQVRLAHCLYQSNREPQARSLLRRLLASPNPPVEAVLEFGRREMDSPGQRKFLRRKLKSALASEPSNPTLLFQLLAEAQRRDGLTLEGLEELNRAFRRKDVRPTPKLLLLRARLRADAGDLEGALSDSSKAMRKDRSLHGALKFHVSTLASLERYDEAIETMGRRLQDGVYNADLMALLGKLYLKAGQGEKGRETLMRAYTLGCRLPEVLNALASIFARDGEHLDVALRIARQALRQSRDTTTLATLGYVYLSRGQAERALRHFEQALDASSASGGKGPEQVVTALHLRRGLALKALGRPKEAAAAFERAHSPDPGSPGAPSDRGLRAESESSS